MFRQRKFYFPSIEKEKVALSFPFGHSFAILHIRQGKRQMSPEISVYAMKVRLSSSVFLPFKSGVDSSSSFSLFGSVKYPIWTESRSFQLSVQHIKPLLFRPALWSFSTDLDVQSNFDKWVLVRVNPTVSLFNLFLDSIDFYESWEHAFLCIWSRICFSLPLIGLYSSPNAYRDFRECVWS